MRPAMAMNLLFLISLWNVSLGADG